MTQPPPPAQLMQMITGHWVAAAVHVMARLEIPDAIGDGCRAVETIATDVGAHAPSVFRLLRALASLGLAEEVTPRAFKLTATGQLLRKDVPGSLRGMALFQGAPPHWSGWGTFAHSVKTGESAFEHVHGKSFFDYLSDDPRYAEAFNDAMTGNSRGSVQAVLDAYDFSEAKTLVDVGGGHGALVIAILERYPELRGGVIDMPGVVGGARRALDARDLAGRCMVLGGDFFTEVPAADTYIAKHIIHDWGDEDCVRILTAMRNGMQGRGKVLIVDAVIPPGNDPNVAKLLDLEMLNTTHGGKERSEEEFAGLLRAAGFRLERVIPTQGMVSIVEAGLP
jgi:hypothetical protein